MTHHGQFVRVVQLTVLQTFFFQYSFAFVQSRYRRSVELIDAGYVGRERAQLLFHGVSQVVQVRVPFDTVHAPVHVVDDNWKTVQWKIKKKRVVHNKKRRAPTRPRYLWFVRGLKRLCVHFTRTRDKKNIWKFFPTFFSDPRRDYCDITQLQTLPALFAYVATIIRKYLLRMSKKKNVVHFPLTRTDEYRRQHEFIHIIISVVGGRRVV